MTFHEPRKLSLLLAAVVTLTYEIILLAAIFSRFFESLPWLTFIIFLVFSSVLLFLITFFLSEYLINKFIYSKIRLIYKSIHAVKSGRKEPPVSVKNGKGSMERVQAEVEQWEAEKRDELEKLKMLEQYRREFIGNLSHELKTPLFNIQGYVSTLADGGLEDPKINREYLHRTEQSVERLVKILEDLDEISQFESGHMKMNICNFDLYSLACEVVESLEMKASKKGINIVVNEPDKPVIAEGDMERIRQVLTNIIDNSLRYGLKGNGRTKVSFFDMDEHILTEITDNGIGVDQGDLPRLFERFYRTERGRATSRKGKGLGLAIVKHIIEAHGQTIHVRSKVGVGTTFGFTLRKV